MLKVHKEGYGDTARYAALDNFFIYGSKRLR